MLPLDSTWPIVPSLIFFGLAVLVIIVAGVRLTALADQLAERTGLGQAVVGALFLGAATSLPGLVTSITAAAHGRAELAISNALGGIAVQTAFLAIADLTYRKANLEHAAASEANLLQGVLLIILLTVPLLAMAGPEVHLAAIHPATPVLVLVFIGGMRLVSHAHTHPMWHPHRTPETWRERPGADRVVPSGWQRLGVRFIILASLVGGAGWVVAHAGIALSIHTGVSETFIGSMLTAVSTSLPELAVAVAAVRRGALTLAVGDILGGNAFDTLFVALSDLAYRQGSIYHVLSQQQVFLMAATMLLTGILLLGLLRREKHGIANIGFESFLVLILYVGFAVMTFLRA